jgi:hypothetical protein
MWKSELNKSFFAEVGEDGFSKEKSLIILGSRVNVRRIGFRKKLVIAPQ